MLLAFNENYIEVLGNRHFCWDQSFPVIVLRRLMYYQENGMY